MEQDNKKKRNWWVWILIILLVVILLAIGMVYAVWKMVSKGIDQAVNSGQNGFDQQEWKKSISELEEQVNKAIEDEKKKDNGDNSVKQGTDVNTELKNMDENMNSVSAEDYNQEALSDKEVGLID